MMTSKRALYAFFALTMSFGLSAGPMAAWAKKEAGGSNKQAVRSARTPSKTPLESSGSDESTLRERIAELAAAASAGDAAKMASLWLTDGLYVDEDGTETRGRQSIEQRFAEVRSGNSRINVAIHPTTIKLIGPHAAWAEGTVSRPTSLGMEPSTRFTMLFEKSAGNWMISSATETTITNKNVTDRLEPLRWLIGDWSAERGDGKVKMTAQWTNNKAFILCRFDLEQPEGASRHDSQVIGWDPTRQQIVSWHFDSSGGFGYGSWSRRGKQWVIQVEGVEQSGSHTQATNIITLEDRDKFSWQSVGRLIDGVPVADMQPLVVQRATN